ncbi:helix-turn-helix domain-containing protein [Rheinheimera sp.]|uniref:helix-turn-helix domain-containing protein n=1 Tax=Rheinheimera sp. TaxID=1869214 RepID=UPI00307F9AFC
MREQQQQEFSYLGFRRFYPEAMLCELVDCFWAIGGGQGLPPSSVEKLYPDGGCSLTFELGLQQASACFEFNRQTKTRQFFTQQPQISVRLFAGALFQLFRLPPSELPDHGCDATELLSGTMRQQLLLLLQQLPDLSTAAAVASLEQWLIRLWLDSVGSARTQAALQLLQQSELNVAGTAAELGISSRTLERQLLQQVGLSPAYFQLCQRLKQARLRLAQTQQPLAQLALDLGFYDQAHFSHAFRDFVGETPAGYRQRKLSQIYKAKN